MDLLVSTAFLLLLLIPRTMCCVAVLHSTGCLVSLVHVYGCLCADMYCRSWISHSNTWFFFPLRLGFFLFRNHFSCRLALGFYFREGAACAREAAYKLSSDCKPQGRDEQNLRATRRPDGRKAGQGRDFGRRFKRWSPAEGDRRQRQQQRRGRVNGYARCRRIFLGEASSCRRLRE